MSIIEIWGLYTKREKNKRQREGGETRERDIEGDGSIEQGMEK